MGLPWSKEAQHNFDAIINSLPQFHRSIAQRLVKETAENLAKSRGAPEVGNEDLTKAFFQEVPPAFKEMMKRLFREYNIDYQKYIKQE